ncbi:nuclear transport factor 2 family protein [Thalassotalea ganghwensis]
MKSLIITIITTIALLIPSKAFANDDINQISQTIQWYFDGTSQGKPELVEKAFMPSLELQYIAPEGQFKRWQGTDYISNINPGKSNDRVGKIVAIDVTGNSAMAKATITSGDRLFTDYFLLLKVDGQWKITNKIFYKGKK